MVSRTWTTWRTAGRDEAAKTDAPAAAGVDCDGEVGNADAARGCVDGGCSGAGGGNQQCQDGDCGAGGAVGGGAAAVGAALGAVVVADAHWERPVTRLAAADQWQELLLQWTRCGRRHLQHTGQQTTYGGASRIGHTHALAHATHTLAVVCGGGVFGVCIWLV